MQDLGWSKSTNTLCFLFLLCFARNHGLVFSSASISNRGEQHQCVAVVDGVRGGSGAVIEVDVRALVVAAAEFLVRTRFSNLCRPLAKQK